MSKKLKLTKVVTELHIVTVLLIITLTTINNMYLEISNQGEMETDALMLMGATSKDGQSTIGMFGTGNKYALALLLREGHEINIFSGMREITVETKEHKFRDKSFNVLYVDGQKTSITTDTGKINWRLWMAIRELYSNAVDEGGAAMKEVERIVPEKNKTKVYVAINGIEMRMLLTNIREYFPSSGSIIYENELGRVYNAYNPVSDTHFYRKGIMMLQQPRSCIYNYDLFDVRLDENRRPLYSWELEERLWNFIFSIEDKEILRNILGAYKVSPDCSEAQVSGLATIGRTKSSIVQEVANELNIIPKEYSGMLSVEDLKNATPVPKKVYVAIKGEADFEGMRWLDQAGSFMILKETSMQEHMLKKAMDFFDEVRFSVIGEIKVATFEKRHILGSADTEKKIIYIADRTFELGQQKLVETIMEESFHIESGFSDMTRPFQDFLIRKVVNIYKAHHSYTL